MKVLNRVFENNHYTSQNKYNKIKFCIHFCQLQHNTGLLQKLVDWYITHDKPTTGSAGTLHNIQTTS